MKIMLEFQLLPKILGTVSIYVLGGFLQVTRLIELTCQLLYKISMITLS